VGHSIQQFVSWQGIFQSRVMGNILKQCFAALIMNSVSPIFADEASFASISEDQICDNLRYVCQGTFDKIRKEVISLYDDN